jgi:AraC-like DNA-binding protein
MLGEQPYTEQAPPPDLAPFVDRFWWQTTRRAEPGRIQRVLPDGCVDVLIHADRGVGELVGPMTRALAFPAGPAQIVAVRFRPGTAAALARCALVELADDHAELDQLDPRAALVERVAGAVARGAGRRTTGDRAPPGVRVLIDWLRSRLAGLAPDPIAAHAVALLARGARVDATCAAVGVTRQHLARVFRREVGLTPKALARIARMQRATAALGTVPLARLAAELGYFDQAHLGNELHALAGATPRALAAARPITLGHLYVPFLQGRVRGAP